MLNLYFFLITLTILKYGTSVPLSEVIEPVDLSYTCLKVGDGQESQSKSPILLLHGVTASRNSWKGLDLLLADRTKRRVCAVDLRNHGDSPWNNRFDVAALAVDIGHFLDEQGIKKINFIGHSLGGKTAIHFALNNPDRVDSIIVEDFCPNTLTQQGISEVSTFLQIANVALERIPEGTPEDEAKKSIINFLNKKLEEMGSSEQLPDIASNFIEIKLIDGKWRFRHNMAVINESLKNITSFMTKSSGLYEGPALFIYGTKSPFKVGEDKQNILELFPKAQLAPVEGAGHIIHGIFPQFDDIVLRFFKELK